MDRALLLACVICGILFSVLGLASFFILWAVNWRPWRIYSFKTELSCCTVSAFDFLRRCFLLLKLVLVFK
ncbi:hypothetical protein ACSQ67_004517 [Phaseolus vulgaris]